MKKSIAHSSVRGQRYATLQASSTVIADTRAEHDFTRWFKDLESIETAAPGSPPHDELTMPSPARNV